MLHFILLIMSVCIEADTGTGLLSGVELMVMELPSGKTELKKEAGTRTKMGVKFSAYETAYFAGNLSCWNDRDSV
jgi:hypothetical protein